MERKKRSKFTRVVFWLGFLTVVIFFSFFLYLESLKGPVGDNTQVKAFVIMPGDNVAKIAEKLESEGLIKSAWVFKQELKKSGKDDQIEAGDYKLSESMSVAEVIKTLTEGALDKWVTLIEGWRVEQIANKLNSELGIDKAEFLKSAEEGYMFPDTYLFNPDATPSDIASVMKNNFSKKYTQELKDKIKAQGLSEKEGVILASMVEREGRSEKVRTEVAGILLKRLKMGMKLDIDATVQYAKDSQSLKNGALEKFWQPITQAEYSSVVSPYNTYLNNGLPPGPICNPSLMSLQAVANADSNTPYVYYYHDLEGNSHYARTLEEHNANVATYR